MNCLDLPKQRVAVPDFVDGDSDGEEEETERNRLIEICESVSTTGDNKEEIGVVG